MLGGNVTNMLLIFSKETCVSVVDDDTSWYGYYLIVFSSSPFTLQWDLNIFGQVISSDEMVCEGYYLPPIIINYNYCASSTNKTNNTVIPLRKIINGGVSARCYDFNEKVPPSLRDFS